MANIYSKAIKPGKSTIFRRTKKNRKSFRRKQDHHLKSWETQNVISSLEVSQERVKKLPSINNTTSNTETEFPEKFSHRNIEIIDNAESRVNEGVSLFEDDRDDLNGLERLTEDSKEDVPTDTNEDLRNTYDAILLQENAKVSNEALIFI